MPNLFSKILNECIMAVKNNKRILSLNYSKSTLSVIKKLKKKGFINAIITNKKHKTKTITLLLKYNNSFSSISCYSLNSKTTHKREITNKFDNKSFNFIENIIHVNKIRSKKFLLTRLR